MYITFPASRRLLRCDRAASPGCQKDKTIPSTRRMEIRTFERMFH
ncbi:hypothetical protein P5V15_012169 [Pogonomyrmex californicus]